MDIGKKVKKKAIRIAEATAIELLKELVRRLLRRKLSPAIDEVPCNVVDRFESFFVKEFGEFFSRGYGHNIVNIMNEVCSHLGKESEITKYLEEANKEHEWIDREFSDVRLALQDYEKYGDKELFERANRHLLHAVRRYVKLAKPLNEILLIHGKSETLKAALKTIETHYAPVKEHFNRLIYDYYRFALRNKEYLITKGQYETMMMYLPDIPSKENQLTFMKITKEEPVTR